METSNYEIRHTTVFKTGKRRIPFERAPRRCHVDYISRAQVYIRNTRDISFDFKTELNEKSIREITHEA